MNKTYIVYLLMILLGFSLLTMAFMVSNMGDRTSDVAVFLRKADRSLRTYAKSNEVEQPYNITNQLKKLEYGKMSDYQLTQFIGKGAFAQVYKAKHSPTGDDVAIKFLVKGLSKRSSTELKILQQLKNAPNMNKLRDVIQGESEFNQGNVTLVFDYLKNQTVEDLFETLTPFKIKHYIYETLKTLEYAHQRGIMHRDIKPLNVLMDQDTLQVKVIDWNQAEYDKAGENYTVRISSLHYKAPELLMNNTYYNKQIDIWATGTILAEMMFLKYHFFASERVHENEIPKQEAKWRSFRDQLDAISQVIGSKELFDYVESLGDPSFRINTRDVGDYQRSAWDNFIDDNNLDLVDDLGLDLLDKMLVIDPSKRITSSEALQHPFFNEVRDWKVGDPIPE